MNLHSQYPSCRWSLSSFLATMAAGVCFTCATLQAVQERDWLDFIPTDPLEETKRVPLIDIDQMDEYAFSVTYALDGGRFGDQIVNYMKALWVSWKYDVPLVYRPFDHSEELILSDCHPIVLSEDVGDAFDAKIELLWLTDREKTSKIFKHLNGRTEPKKRSALWSIGLLTPFHEEHFCEKMDDEEFRVVLQRLIKPKTDIPLLSLPKDRKNVAVHVRTGVGYDWEINIRNMPTKFPPDTFYLSGIKQAANYFKGEPLYVFLFTDHPSPPTVKERFLKEMAGWDCDIILDCHPVVPNVLEDLFSMMQFDCIVHPDSSLSRLASIVAGPLLEVKPSHWAEIRRDLQGIPVLDKKGGLIVDLLIHERAEKGMSITKSSYVPIESEFLE